MTVQRKGMKSKTESEGWKQGGNGAPSAQFVGQLPSGLPWIAGSMQYPKG